MSILSSDEKKSIRFRSQLLFPWDPTNKREIGIALEGAYVIALKTLGQKWVERNIAPTPEQNKSDFMKRGLSLEQDRLIHVDRVIYLAEFLDRLANVKNFTSKLKDLKTKSLEETFFELQVAASLHSQSLLLEFVVPKNVKGRDDDLIASINGATIPVEVKCRTAETSFNENMLKNPLKHAARVQLPQEGPNVIFYKIPAAWLNESDFVCRAEAALQKFLKDYTRINAVVLCWDEWVKPTAPTARLRRFKIFVNPKPRRMIEGIERIMRDQGLLYTYRNRLGISFM